jgi:hypothetical protein
MAFTDLSNEIRDWSLARRAAEQRDEIAPPYHSITSSARSRIDEGTLRPSAFAVLRLTVNDFDGGRARIFFMCEAVDLVRSTQALSGLECPELPQLRPQIVPWSTLCRADWLRNDPILTTRGWLPRHYDPVSPGAARGYAADH